MRIGLLTVDGRGAVALFNTAAEQILGYRAREVRGKPAEEIVDGLTDLLAAAGPGPPDNRPDMQLSRNARHKDGRIIPLVVTPYHLTPGDSSTRTGNDDPTAHVASGSAERPAPPWSFPGGLAPPPDPRTAQERHSLLMGGSAGGAKPHPAAITKIAARRECGAPTSAVHPNNGVVLVFQDARQLQKMENQLQHLDRLHSLDEFAAGIVHEIRNPLASISINAQHIVEEIKRYCQQFRTGTGRGPSPDEAGHGRAGGDRFLSKINEEMQDILADVQSIESIVKKVLDFAHPNKPQVRSCPIGDIVEEVLRFSRMPLRRQGIRLVTDLNTPARVRVDVSQMKQVLFNIVRNACDVMPGGGELRVSTGRASLLASRGWSSPSDPENFPRTPRTGASERGAGSREALPAGRQASPSPPAEGVRVEVEDTGRGIPEEYLERIFDPFFSMHARGTGLGLAISRKIVESHGGRIEVRSKPGDGTTFGIVLPAV